MVLQVLCSNELLYTQINQNIAEKIYPVLKSHKIIQKMSNVRLSKKNVHTKIYRLILMWNNPNMIA